MRRETTMGVLQGLKRRFAPIVVQNAFSYKTINSVIMLESFLISRFMCHICRQPLF